MDIIQHILKNVRKFDFFYFLLKKKSVDVMIIMEDEISRIKIRTYE